MSGNTIDNKLPFEEEYEDDYNDSRPKKFAVVFTAVNNDTYDEWVRTLFFEDLPADIKEVVRKTYDGVWEPQLDMISVYKLTKLYDIMK